MFQAWHSHPTTTKYHSYQGGEWTLNLLYYCGFCRFCYPFSTQEEGNKKDKGRKDEKRKEEMVAGEKEEERYQSMPEH